MRHGFTTGSCAAAAAKAAAYMLLTGKIKTEITIETPGGIPYKAKLLDISREEKSVSCAVEKDGGDDPDVTTGMWIYAKVSYVKGNAMKKGNILEKADISEKNNVAEKGNILEKNSAAEKNNIIKKGDCVEEDNHTEKNWPELYIEGGVGVGRVTKPGLDQPVGSAAINRVPREMIKKEVAEVCRLTDYRGSLKIEISAPKGEKITEQTFNPRLGIVGGISILGTSGIVEPMSSRAILDTIKIELNQRRELGFDYAVISPGNYGLEFMKKAYGYDLDKSVKCSNFIGETVDMAVELGFRRLLVTGHIGKMIKVAGGIMNTHSREADCRMELLAAFSLKARVDLEQARKILDCGTTEEAVGILARTGKLSQVMEYAAERICFYLEKRAGGRLSIDCILYAKLYADLRADEFVELARSKGAEKWFTLLAQDAARQI
ncbi:MAG: cobalt-precorrin-5B (C(1))-methyltransferase CbiD [Clostridium sp.]|nr:cobalt-precorrin-5B (C(1))-methyltransferase CbiD [Clostridium sp.]